MQNNAENAQADTTSVPIIIVGAGPTGLAAANLLGQAGIETLVLERNTSLSDCPKAISIDDEGLRVCQAMGLYDEIVKHVVLNIEAHYVSARHLFAKVAPTRQRNGFPLISTFDQPAFEEALLQGLARFPCVEVRFQHTVETCMQGKDNVTLTVSTPENTRYTMQCSYLLACDGGKSPIRHMLNIPMEKPTLLPRLRRRSKRETDKRQRWLVVDTVNDDDTSTAATFFCSYRRPAVSVPAPHNARRWEFMLLPGEDGEDLLDDAIIHDLIRQARAAHPFMQNTVQQHKPLIIRKTIYTFRTVLAQKFMQGRIFLLGDAAHLMPPFGGQGMNSGLRDAHNLCWKLQLVLQGRDTPRLLETYSTERYPHVREMILFSSLLGDVVMTTTHTGAWFRDRFFALVNALPPLRDAITEMRVKPQPRYKKGFVLSLPFDIQNGAGDTFSQRTPTTPFSQRTPTRGYPTILPSRASHAQASYSRVAPCGRPSSLGNPIARFKQLFKHNPKLVGSFLPQPYVSNQKGERVLLDDVLGNGFAVLRLYEEPEVAFENIQEDMWQQIGVKRVCVLPRGTTNHEVTNVGYEFVSDVDGQLGVFLRHRRDIVVLVRPDRYVAGIYSL